MALFLALTGGAVAAVLIPANSVGSSQIKNGAVGSAKIAVHEVQVRVGGTCVGLSAVDRIGDDGKVACRRTVPAEIGTAGLVVSVPDNSGAGLVADESLPAGNTYLVTASPQIQVSGTNVTPQLVAVTCTLQGGSTRSTETTSVDLSPTIGAGFATLNLTATLPVSATATVTGLACTAASAGGSSTPKVVVSGGINALQTLRNEVQTSAGVTPTTAVTVTSPSTTATATTATTTSTTGTTTTGTTTTTAGTTT